MHQKSVSSQRYGGSFLDKDERYNTDSITLHLLMLLPYSAPIYIKSQLQLRDVRITIALLLFRLLGCGALYSSKKVADVLEVRPASIIVIYLLLARLQDITPQQTAIFVFVTVRTYKYQYVSFLSLRILILVAFGVGAINLSVT
jgi:hypothetical protein